MSANEAEHSLAPVDVKEAGELFLDRRSRIPLSRMSSFSDLEREHVHRAGDAALEAPIYGDDRRRPSRRRVSGRWLAGTFLTGVTGVVLLGGALQAPLAGFAMPQAALESAGVERAARRARRGDRPVLPSAASRERVVQVPVVSREGARRPDPRREGVAATSRLRRNDAPRIPEPAA